MEKESLYGLPFIADKYRQVFMGSLIGHTDRTCNSCFYRSEDSGDCEIGDYNITSLISGNNGSDHLNDLSLKELFHVKPDKKMPFQIDGKEVAHYCPAYFDIMDGEKR